MPPVGSSSSLLGPAQCGLFHMESSDTATLPLLVVVVGFGKGSTWLACLPLYRAHLLLGLPHLCWVPVPHVVLLVVFQFPWLSGLETTEGMRS